MELQQSDSQSHRAACQRHERSFTHNNNPSKSALTGLWVITVLSLECFVFRFACSVSKANNHSLFTVWVGAFFFFSLSLFLQQGKLHTRVTALRERQDQQPRRVLVSAVLNQRGQGRWLQPCSLLTLWQGQKRVGDMDILYSYSAHYNKLPSIAAIKSPRYTIPRYLSNTSYLKKEKVQSIHCSSSRSELGGGCPNSKIERLSRRGCLSACVQRLGAPQAFTGITQRGQHRQTTAHTCLHTQTHPDLPAWLVWGMLSLLEGFMMANRG